MPMKTKITWIVIFLIGTLVGKGQNYTPVETKTEFKALLKSASVKMSTITADFDQIKFLSFMEEEIKSSGTFYFLKPNKVRWEYLHPSAYYLILNENKIITFMNGKKSIIDASKNKTFSEINKIMLGSINGEIANHPDFESKLFEDATSFRLNLKLKSKALRDVMNEIIIWFDKKDMSVSQIKMMEASGDYSFITLKNKRLNEVFSNGLFTD